MRIIPISTAVVATLAFGTASNAAPPDETDEPQRRLAIAFTNSPDLLVLDASTGEEVSRLTLDAPTMLSSAVTEDGRYLLAAHEDGVTVVDGAVWSEPHGTHAHHFAGQPSVVGQVVGDHPSHLISHGNVIALWFDGLGEAAILDADGLIEGEIEEVGRVGSGEPHHGFAVPTEHGAFVVSALAGDDDDGLPDAVTIADGTGEVLESFTCRDVHGEAALGDGTYAAACADGVLVLHEDEGSWSGELVAYPDTGDVDPYGYGAARLWAIDVDPLAADGLGALGTTNLMHLDPTVNATTAIDLGTQIATLGIQRVDSQRTLVLTTDGRLHLVDLETEAIVSSIDVVEPFAEGEGIEDTYHQLVITGDIAYISDPRNESVIAFEVGDDLVAGRTIDLAGEPAYIGVLNG